MPSGVSRGHRLDRVVHRPHRHLLADPRRPGTAGRQESVDFRIFGPFLDFVTRTCGFFGTSVCINLHGESFMGVIEQQPP